MAELLFWPALLAYSEAAVAYLNDARHPGTGGKLATWGVRIGWLVQTALLGVQAARADGFPWSTWAGSLNLFVWLVVGAYLIWGCQPRYRLLGLAVLPLAVVLRYARHVRPPAPAAAASVWQCASAPARPPRSAPLPGPALVMKNPSCGACAAM